MTRRESTEALNPARLAEIRGRATADVPYLLGRLTDDEFRLDTWIRESDSDRDALLAEVDRLTAALAAERAAHEGEVSALVDEGIRQKRRANAVRARVQRVEAVCAVWDNPPWRDAQQRMVRRGHARQIRAALAGGTEKGSQ